MGFLLTLLHSERPKLYAILVFPSAKGLKARICLRGAIYFLLFGRDAEKMLE